MMKSHNATTTARSKLAWRCRRGMLELDLLLQGFLDSGYDELSADERAAFDALLGVQDNMLLEYLLGRMTPADSMLARVVAAVRRSAHS